MYNIFNFLSVNFINFYNELNNVGKLVFFIAVLLFLVLIVLIVIMLIQKSMSDRQVELIHETEKQLDRKEQENITNNDIDMNNEKTRDLKNIVDELKKIDSDKKDATDMYEDEQEKTAIISYQELLKAANENVVEPTIKKVELPKVETVLPIIEEPKQKKPEIFSSVFTPSQEPIYKNSKNNIEILFNDDETFLNSLKEFRNNL